MASYAIDTIIALSVQGTLMGLTVALLLRIFGKYVSPRFRLFAWLLVFFKFIIPLKLQSPLSFFRLFDSGTEVGQVISGRATVRFSEIPVSRYTAAVIDSASPGNGMGIFTVILLCWAAVTVLLVFAFFNYYYSTKIRIYRQKHDEPDIKAAEITAECFEKAGIRADTETVCSSFANSFFVFGLFKPLVVVPARLSSEMSECELRFALTHEAVHIKRRHYVIKFIAFFINIFNWFNPFVWYFTSKLDEAMEFDCDYALTKGSDSEKKTEYAQTLVHVAKHYKRSFAAGLTFGKSNFYRRVETILNGRNFTRVFAIISTVILVMLSVGFFTLAAENNSLSDKLTALEQESRKTDAPRIAETEQAERDEPAQTTDAASSDPYTDMGRQLLDEMKRSAGEIINTNGGFWVNAFQKNMTFDELKEKLPNVTGLDSEVTNPDSLVIDVKGMYVCFEYTNEKTLRAEVYDKEDYSTPYTYTFSDNGTKVTFIAKPSIQTSYDLSFEPRLIKVFVPESLNDFSDVIIKNSMGHASICGLKADNFVYKSAMAADSVTGNMFKSMDIESSMSSMFIDIESAEKLTYKGDMGSTMMNIGTILGNSSVIDNMGNIKLTFKKPADYLTVKLEVTMSSANLPKGWNVPVKSSFGSTHGSGDTVLDISVDMGTLTIIENR